MRGFERRDALEHVAVYLAVHAQEAEITLQRRQFAVHRRRLDAVVVHAVHYPAVDILQMDCRRIEILRRYACPFAAPCGETLHIVAVVAHCQR